MLKYKTSPAETRTRITLETMSDVVQARRTIFLGRLAANESARKKIPVGEIPVTAIVGSEEQLPNDLSFNNSELMLSGLRRVIEKRIDEPEHELNPLRAFEILRLLDVKVDLPSYLVDAPMPSSEVFELPKFEGEILARSCTMVK